MTRRKPPELLGLTEAADYIGVSRKTMHQWVVRGTHNLPPHAALACGPVWRASDIAAWSARHRILTTDTPIH